MRRGSDAIRVLHVDDEPDFADLATTFLEREDDRFDTETATSADEGLDRLSRRAYDCIVSDYDMPRTNGIEFLEQVREEWPDIPFILFTGKGSEEVASEAISAGVTDYIQKQSGSDQYTLLANRIRNAVGRREAERERNRQLEAIETAREGISILDEDGHYIYVNQRYADLHGYDPEELIGEHWELLYRDADIPDVREDILPKVKREGYWHGETTSVRADGSTVPLDHTLSVTDRGELVCSVRDITARKQRERELERYERIVGNLPVGVFRTTPDGDFVGVNEQYLSLLGVSSRGDLAEFNAREFWADSEDRETLVRQLEEEGVVENREVKIETPSGESKWVETTLRFTYEDGDRYLDGIAHDVTERRERRQRLEQAKTMFENAQDSLFLIDVSEEFTVERVNPAYEEATGLSNDALSGRTPRDILGDEQGAEIVQRYRECVERRTALEYEETLSIDGDRSYWETRISPVVVDGDVEKIVGATRNITERKEREEELRQTADKLEVLFEEAPVMTVLTRSEDGRPIIEDCNSQFVETLGYDADTVIGSELAEFYTPESAERLQSGGYSRSLEGRFAKEKRELVTRDGEVIETLLRAVPRRTADDDTTGTVAMYIDITEQEAVKRANERLEEFTSVVSHDLRNPLNVATGHLELAAEECDSVHLDGLEQALSRMEMLIDDLLAFAREGRAVTDSQPVGLATVVNSCWQNVETGEGEVIANTDRRIRADRSRLKQVFENLFRNAVEHGGEEVTVTVCELDDGFYVEDDGPGIPEDERDDVFDAGYTTTDEGTGFGLSIVKQVVDAHDWKIRVAEGTEGGARFEVTDVEFEQ